MKGEKEKNQNRKAERLLKDQRNSGFMHDPQNRTDIKDQHLHTFFEYESNPQYINPSLLHCKESRETMEQLVTPSEPKGDGFLRVAPANTLTWD